MDIIASLLAGFECSTTSHVTSLIAPDEVMLPLSDQIRAMEHGLEGETK